jgi:acylphosphatase
MGIVMSDCRIYHYGGRVQGVGFRYTARNIALRYKVAGYVRNLPDGRVEMRVEGTATEIDAMTAELARKMEGFIRAVTMEEQPAGEMGDGFSIRR